MYNTCRFHAPAPIVQERALPPHARLVLSLLVLLARCAKSGVGLMQAKICDDGVVGERGG
jgi:hypothetical protein